MSEWPILSPLTPDERRRLLALARRRRFGKGFTAQVDGGTQLAFSARTGLTCPPAYRLQRHYRLWSHGDSEDVRIRIALTHREHVSI